VDDNEALVEQTFLLGQAVVRGGSFRDLAWLQRSAQRFTQPRETKSESVGFRVARTLPK
jgi:formylglycine-generating enzyme required for sulfatase activity